ncbi:MAG TPA: hypothetical protein VFM59_07330 [Salinimicrobium sp.]|nr:hypothetical protein [Salinimicrobium sp.]
MKTNKLVFILFLLLSCLFIGGSIMDIPSLVLSINFMLIPSLILYYRLKAKEIVFPLLVVMFFFYLRDILLFWSERYPLIIFGCFFGAILILLICTITGFQKARVNPVEYISFIIMYGFLGFLFISMGEMIPNAVPSFKYLTYLYLFTLVLFLGLSFTFYLIKSHYSSLWLMLAAASLMVSELSLFFKTFILEDLSVIIFYPVFHVFTYYALIKYAMVRRETNKIPYF